ncbi:trimeric autotransporter adhesin [Bisgaardia hudsonensis]|uniref:Trimeric autotransporter adhesin n=1 Tax=Bisgaardia hudsonensis TaxID=109472 RepID=A0A4R2N0Z8_9PAST|nr:YadA-like family protein [Bisgaardia hudsonensis]QLB13235.1 hypothetical protein A6A11_06220 [Bisgaardia hudsonensis]TCP13184.1 trimeric autotransporter adhesin [Bisgaardia hudsonensis]
MNHIYKVVFNKSKGVFTVVSENAKSRCKSTKRSVLTKGEVDSTSSQLKYKLGLVALSVMLGLSPIAANASIAISKTKNTNTSTGAVDNNNNDEYKAKFAGDQFDGDASLNYHNPGNPYYDKDVAEPEKKNLHSPDGNKKAGQTIAIGRDANPVRGKGKANNGGTTEYDVGSGIAIGDFSKATGGLSIGLGHFSQATETGAIAVGTSSLASGFNSLALMRQSAATDDYAIALGTTSYAQGKGSLAVGFSSQAVGTQSIAIGSATAVKKDSEGADAKVAGFDKITNTVATGDYAIALGAQSKGEGKSSVALGKESIAKEESSLALGTSSKAEGKSSIAVGLSSIAKQESAVALGKESKAEGKSSIAVGLSSEAKKESSVALGSKSKAEGKSSVAVGLSSQAKEESSVALGESSKAEGKSSIALGLSSQAKKESSIAIGNKAIVDNKNSVALGAGSKDKAVDLKTATATVGEFTYSGFAAVQTTQDNGVVSLGDKGKERQLVNVAAGAIKADSTDAINGSQLYFVAKTITDNIPFEYKNKDGSKVRKEGDKYYTVKTDGTLDKNNPVDEKNVVINAKGETPQTVSNIASNLPVADDKGLVTLDGKKVAVAKPDESKLAKIKNNAATVEDVLNTGFNLQSNGEAKDFVKAYDTVNFVDGVGTKVSVESDGVKSTVKYSIDNGKLSTNTNGVAEVDIQDEIAKAKDAVTKAQAAAEADKTNVGLQTKLKEAKALQAKLQEKAESKNVATKALTSAETALNAAKDKLKANPENAALKNDVLAKQKALETAEAKLQEVAKDINAIQNDKVATVSNVIDAINESSFNVTSGKEGTGEVSGTKVDKVKAGNTVTFKAGDNLKLVQDGKNFTYSLKDEVALTDKDGNKTVINGNGLTVTPKDATKKPVSLTKDGLDNGGNQIVNVAAGTKDTDAVNLSQLKDLDAKFTDNSPFEYLDGDKNKVVKLGDKFYPAGTTLDAKGNPVKDGKPVKPAENVVINAKGTTPQTISNIASNLPVTNDKGKVLDKNGKPTNVSVEKPNDAKLAKIKNNAATVEDVLNTGFNLQGNGEAKDFVKAYDTVDFVDGVGTKVAVESDGVKSTVKYSIDKGTITAVDGKLVGTSEADKAKAKDALDAAKAAVDAAPNDEAKKAELAKAQAKVDAINNKVATVENVVETVNTIVDRGSISTRDDGIAVADVKPTAAIEAKEEELLNAINELMTLEAAGEDTSTVESKVAQIKEDLQELKDNSSVNQLATVKNVADAINNSSFNVVAGAEGTGVVENNTSEKVKAGDTVALKAGDNLKLVQDGKNFTYSLKDVVTLTNKDGTAGVALNGKDGTIGLNGKDGSDATIGVQAGKAGLDGAEGTTKTRIVYETKDGTKEEVATLNDGLIFGADSGTEYKAKLGSKVNVQGDGTNISTKVEGNNISVKLSNNIKVDGATIAKNFVVQNGATINLGNNVVNNVADGEVSATSKQAINGSQLYNVQSKINGRINKVDKDLRAGVAGAMATAGLPQVYTPGKSMVAVAGGTYQGQNAVALGVSRISDNGKVIIKLSGNADSRGKFGATIGAGYQW